MSDIVRSHCDMLLPDAQREEFCTRLADHIASALSKQSKFDELAQRLPELSLGDLLTLSLVVNDGVVLFSSQADNALAARFVPITEDAPPSPTPPPLPECLDSFERELAEGEMNADLDFTPCFGKAGMENHMW